jgi:hypothetical protein
MGPGPWVVPWAAIFAWRGDVVQGGHAAIAGPRSLAGIGVSLRRW